MPLKVDYRNPAEDKTPRQANWMWLTGPPILSYVCWPVSLILFGYLGALLALIIVLFCVPWGWSISKRVASRYGKSFTEIASIETMLVLSSYPALFLAVKIFHI